MAEGSLEIDMRSPRGFAAAVVFLLALPMTIAFQRIVGRGEEVVVHAALALGSVLMSFAVFDFRTPKWIAWVGCLSMASFAGILVLQGVSRLIQSATLADLAFRVLGQRVEGWLADLFLLWCIAALLIDSHGKTKVLGVITVSMAVCVEVYANGLSLLGASLESKAPGLKLLNLLPFVWLLFESKQAEQPVAAIAAG